MLFRSVTRPIGTRSSRPAPAAASDEIRTLTEDIATDTKELERLGQTARAHVNTGALDTEVDALRAKLKTVGITVASAKPDTMTVRGWRAALESQISQSRSASERLSLLAKEMAVSFKNFGYRKVL